MPSPDAALYARMQLERATSMLVYFAVKSCLADDAWSQHDSDSNMDSDSDWESCSDSASASDSDRDSDVDTPLEVDVVHGCFVAWHWHNLVVNKRK